MRSHAPMIPALFCTKCSAASTPTRISGRKKAAGGFSPAAFPSSGELLSRRHRAGGSLLALRDVEEILLRSALLEYIERVNQLVVVRNAAALGCRIAERQPGDG